MLPSCPAARTRFPSSVPADTLKAATTIPAPLPLAADVSPVRPAPPCGAATSAPRYLTVPMPSPNSISLRSPYRTSPTTPTRLNPKCWSACCTAGEPLPRTTFAATIPASRSFVSLKLDPFTIGLISTSSRPNPSRLVPRLPHILALPHGNLPCLRMLLPSSVPWSLPVWVAYTMLNVSATAPPVLSPTLENISPSPPPKCSSVPTDAKSELPNPPALGPPSPRYLPISWVISSPTAPLNPAAGTVNVKTPQLPAPCTTRIVWP